MASQLLSHFNFHTFVYNTGFMSLSTPHNGFTHYNNRVVEEFTPRPCSRFCTAIVMEGEYHKQPADQAQN